LRTGLPTSGAAVQPPDGTRTHNTMPRLRLMGRVVAVMLSVSGSLQAQTPRLPGVPTIPLRPVSELEGDSTAKDVRGGGSALGPVFYRVGAVPPMSRQSPQGPPPVQLPRGGWLLLAGAVLGVYFVIKATSDCSECIVHPVVIVGAALIGIIVASIFLQ
jgi:hypothetical protein